MLVLSRHQNESIIIDGQIEVRIVDIKNGKVRLGIIAPIQTTVNRKELQEKIDANPISPKPYSMVQELKHRAARESAISDNAFTTAESLSAAKNS